MRTRKKCERGAKLLDELRPGWIDEINLETLDEFRFKTSVAGQVFKTDEAYIAFQIANNLEMPVDAADHGFGLHRGDLRYLFFPFEELEIWWLNRTWKRLIHEHRTPHIHHTFAIPHL